MRVDPVVAVLTCELRDSVGHEAARRLASGVRAELEGVRSRCSGFWPGRLGEGVLLLHEEGGDADAELGDPEHVGVRVVAARSVRVVDGRAEGARRHPGRGHGARQLADLGVLHRAVALDIHDLGPRDGRRRATVVGLDDVLDLLARLARVVHVLDLEAADARAAVQALALAGRAPAELLVGRPGEPGRRGEDRGVGRVGEVVEGDREKLAVVQPRETVVVRRRAHEGGDGAAKGQTSDDADARSELDDDECGRNE